MHRPVPRNPAKSFKRRTFQRHPKVALPPFLKPRMSPVRLTFVDHLKHPWREGLTQRCFNFLGSPCHFLSLAPFPRPAKP